MVSENEFYDFHKICRICVQERDNLNSIFDYTISIDKKIYVTDIIRRLTELKVCFLN